MIDEKQKPIGVPYHQWDENWARAFGPKKEVATDAERPTEARQVPQKVSGAGGAADTPDTPDTLDLNGTHRSFGPFTLCNCHICVDYRRRNTNLLGANCRTRHGIGP
jgi:hypothetical protein